MTGAPRFVLSRDDLKWRHVPLVEVATIDRKAARPGKISGQELYVGLEHITSDGEFERVATAEEAGLKSTKFEFTDAHVLYGKLRPYLAKIAAPNFEGICSTDILPIRPGANLDRRYLLHYLRTPEMVAHAANNTVGINLPRLNPRVLESFEIPMPPIAEQRRIAAVLDAAATLRAKRRQALALVDSLTRAIFIDMFGDPMSGKLFSRAPIGAVAEVVTGNTPSRSVAENYGDHIEWLKSDNILESGEITHAAEHLSESGRAKGREAPAGSTLVVCIAGSPRSIGRAGFLNRPAAFNQQINAVLPGPSVLPEFVFRQLRVGQQLVQRASTKSMKGMVSKSALIAVEILVPPIHVQHVFVESVEGIGRTRGAASKSLVATDELFAALQQRAFRGEL